MILSLRNSVLLTLKSYLIVYLIVLKMLMMTCMSLRMGIVICGRRGLRNSKNIMSTS